MSMKGVSFVAKSGTGKTTLIEKVRATGGEPLVRKGIRRKGFSPGYSGVGQSGPAPVYRSSASAP
jgi:hypothetical protein